jgi:hypothetical protein
MTFTLPSRESTYLPPYLTLSVWVSHAKSSVYERFGSDCATSCFDGSAGVSLFFFIGIEKSTVGYPDQQQEHVTEFQSEQKV